VGGTGCSSRFGAPEAATAQGEHILDLWRVLFWAGVGVGGLVIALIGWSLVRYRVREGRDPATFYEHVRLELFYTAVPLVLVAGLFGVTMMTQRDVDRVAAEPDLRIEVTGFQWGWRFRYLTEGITIVGTNLEPPTMVLPVDLTARLTLISPDVIHSFWVPEFLVKRDVIPNHVNRLDVTPTRTGTFGGVCAEFCGLHHTGMTFTVEVVELQQFQAFVAQQQQDEQQQQGPPPGQGGGANPGGQAAPARPPDHGVQATQAGGQAAPARPPDHGVQATQAGGQAAPARPPDHGVQATQAGGQAAPAQAGRPPEVTVG
jgi:cytochrome c oxidase subunit II